MFEQKNKTGPKDVFMHLLSILWLYVSIISFGVLVFQIINIKFPDELSYDYYGSYASNAIKWPLSILVVMFPLFVGFSYYLQKDVTENPEKRDLRVRKWLIYLTLSLAVVVISGDLISLIYTYLSGEITTRFVLKVLTILGIAVSVFVYYLWNLKETEMAIKNPKMRIFLSLVLFAVIGFIIWGFVMAGSPQAARLKRFDDRRVQDLQIIQSQIIYYYQAKKALPNSLAELTDSISGFIAPKDPETKEPYEYEITDKSASFKLCASFSTDTTAADAGRPSVVYDPSGYGDNWSHEKGRVCFDRTIDPDKYSPFANPKI